MKKERGESKGINDNGEMINGKGSNRVYRRYAPADGGIFLKFSRAVNREALHSANFGRKRDGKYVFSQTLQD